MTTLTFILGFFIFLCICKIFSYVHLFFRPIGRPGGFYADAVGGNITWYYSTSSIRDVDPLTGITTERTSAPTYKNPIAWFFHKVLGIWFMGFSPFVRPYKFNFAIPKVTKTAQGFVLQREAINDIYIVPERILVDGIAKEVDIADKTMYDIHFNFPVNVLDIRKALEFDKNEGIPEYTQPRIWSLLHEEFNNTGKTYNDVLSADSRKFKKGIHVLDLILNGYGINIKSKEFAIVDKLPASEATKKLHAAAVGKEQALVDGQTAVINATAEKDSTLQKNIGKADTFKVENEGFKEKLGIANAALKEEALIWNDPKAMALAKTNVTTLAGSGVSILVDGK